MSLLERAIVIIIINYCTVRCLSIADVRYVYWLPYILLCMLFCKVICYCKLNCFTCLVAECSHLAIASVCSYGGIPCMYFAVFQFKL